MVTTNQQTLTPLPGEINLNHLEKTYHSAAGDFIALKDVNLSVAPGEMVAVVGKSGSGKSTLLNLVAGIDRPTAGEVIVSGSAIHTLTEDQIATWRGENVGVVFQFFQLLPTLTVVENVMLPMDFSGKLSNGRRQEKAMQLLARVGIADQAEKLPASLSGGQQQRAAIARALANNPPVLVADEPTGNLDSQNAAQVLALFQDLAFEGKTVLMVTHERTIARYSSRVIKIADGQIVNGDVNAAELSLAQEVSYVPAD